MNPRISHISALQIFQLMRFSTLILIGVVFAKTGLTTSEIGLYETFMLIAGAVSFFWLNGLIQGFLPMTQNQESSGKSAALFNVFYLIAGLSLLTGVFLLVFEHSISEFLLKKPSVPYLNNLLAYILLSSPASLVEYIYLAKNQGKMIVVYGTVSFFLMFLLVVLPPTFGFSIEYSLIGLIASAAIRFLWLLALLIRHSSPKPDFSFIGLHLKTATPLVLSLLLSGSAQYIDGFIITSYFDEATFAVYRFGAREFPLVLLLANAFSASMLPGFADRSKLKINLEQIRNNSQKLAKWLFPLSGVLMLVSHWAFPIVFNSGFAESATIFNIYLLLIVSRLLFPQTILIGLQKNKAILWASFIEIVVNVVLSLWFIQFWGIAGVAYGTVVAYLFEKLVLMIFVRETCQIKVVDYLYLKRHVLYSLLLSAIFVVVEFLIY